MGQSDRSRISMKRCAKCGYFKNAYVGIDFLEKNGDHKLKQPMISMYFHLTLKPPMVKNHRHS